MPDSPTYRVDVNELKQRIYALKGTAIKNHRDPHGRPLPPVELVCEMHPSDFVALALERDVMAFSVPMAANEPYRIFGMEIVQSVERTDGSIIVRKSKGDSDGRS